MNCSFCENEWETDDTGCPVCCNEAVAEWEVENLIKHLSIKNEMPLPK